MKDILSKGQKTFKKGKKKDPVELFSDFPSPISSAISQIFTSPALLKDSKMMFCAAVDARPVSTSKFNYVLLSEAANEYKPFEDNVLLYVSRYISDRIVATVRVCIMIILETYSLRDPCK